MQYLMLFFIFGIVNLCLGYCLAVQIEQKPSSWWQNWTAWYQFRRGKTTAAFEMPARSRAVLPVTNATAESPPPESGRQVEQVGPSNAIVPSEPAVSKKAEAPSADLGPLQRLVDDVTEKLSRLIKRLENPDGDQFCSNVWTIVGGLHEICEPYERRLAEMSAELLEGDGAGGEPLVDDELQGLILDQEAQLETTLSNLQHMDFDAGLSAGIQRVLSEAKANRTTSRKVQQAIETRLATSE